MDRSCPNNYDELVEQVNEFSVAGLAKAAPNMESIADRLKSARQAAGYASATEAAEAMGIAPSTYLGHENGHAGIPAKRAEVYARRFKVSLDWLLTGKSAPDSSRIESATFSLPVLGEVQAGAWREMAAIEASEADQLPVPDDQRILGARQFYLRILGDSVDKVIPAGSYALCCDVWHWARDAADLLARGNGQLVVVQRERAGLYETTIKRLRVNNGLAELWPESTNPKHGGPVRLDDAADVNGVSIIAVVTGAQIKFAGA